MGGVLYIVVDNAIQLIPASYADFIHSIFRKTRIKERLYERVLLKVTTVEKFNTGWRPITVWHLSGFAILSKKIGEKLGILQGNDFELNH